MHQVRQRGPASKVPPGCQQAEEGALAWKLCDLTRPFKRPCCKTASNAVGSRADPCRPPCLNGRCEVPQQPQIEAPAIYVKRARQGKPSGAAQCHPLPSSKQGVIRSGWNEPSQLGRMLSWLFLRRGQEHPTGRKWVALRRPEKETERQQENRPPSRSHL